MFLFCALKLKNSEKNKVLSPHPRIGVLCSMYKGRTDGRTNGLIEIFSMMIVSGFSRGEEKSSDNFFGFGFVFLTE